MFTDVEDAVFAVVERAEAAADLVEPSYPLDTHMAAYV